jgi:hypothetical protein
MYVQDIVQGSVKFIISFAVFKYFIDGKEHLEMELNIILFFLDQELAQ